MSLDPDNPSEIRGFPDNPKCPPPSRPGTMVIPTMRRPDPGGPSNPQGGAVVRGGFIKSHIINPQGRAVIRGGFIKPHLFFK